MNYRQFNAFCRSLPATTYVVQWGGSHVWKVGGKVFAIGGWQEDEPSFTFKVSDVAYEMLKDEPGLRPAPYLASRGMKWIQHFAKPGLSDAGLRDYIRQSHAIVALGLSKKRRLALGLAGERRLPRLVIHSGPRRDQMAKAITIYGIKNCDTMKKARAWLDKHGVAYVFHDYKTQGIEQARLQQWCKTAGWETLLNRAGTTFRKLPESEKADMDAHKAMRLMLDQPSMIKRPVLELGGGEVVVGFAPEIYAAKFGAAKT